MSNLVLLSPTLVVFIYLVAEHSFWRRIAHCGANLSGAGIILFGASLIGSYHLMIFQFSNQKQFTTELSVLRHFSEQLN